jgi:hypothetical protein
MQSKNEMRQVIVRAHDEHVDRCRDCMCRDCIAFVSGVDAACKAQQLKGHWATRRFESG